MISFGSFALATPPRTGAGWFIEAARKAGFRLLGGMATEVPADPLPDVIVSLIRHPYDWLASIHQATKTTKLVAKGSTHFGSIIAHSAGKLDDFVSKVALNYRGHIWSMYESYKANIVLRVEDFPETCVGFFEMMGADPSLARSVRDIPPCNCNECEPYPINKRLRRELCLSESEICERFNYWS